MVNATSPDIDAFRDHGHKLLMYHGWSDWLVAPEESINYWNAVHTRSGASIDQSFRLFMVPGMAHCAGGPGATHFDPLSAVVDWVEHGVAPDKIIASKVPSAGTGDSASFQRPCAPTLAWHSTRGPAIRTMLRVSSAGRDRDALRGQNSNHHRSGFGHRPQHCTALCCRGRQGGDR